MPASYFNIEDPTLKVLSEGKEKLGWDLEQNLLINKSIMSPLVEGFSDVYEYNTRFLSMKETLMNEFSYSPKLVMSRVIGQENPNCSDLSINLEVTNVFRGFARMHS